MAADNPFGKRKPRNPNAERAVRPVRQPAPRILLVCEGEKTEPIYFRDMVRALNLGKQVMIGKNDGSSPDKVVARAEELYAQAQREGDAFDEVYCVFDRDAHERFKEAVARLHELRAKGQPLNGIVSVPCFEFWLLLHFGYTEKPYASRGNKSVGNAVVSDLKKNPGFAKYDKGMVGVFELLAPHLEQSLKHAQRLMSNPASNDEHPNPSTQVHILVNRLKSVTNKKP
ncbi:MAG: RloB family protein [Giesbergeria sp.]|uniref:RloB family protein n=1 Tax=Giesbergeria sp. TaxID=2818473 RepID=UPI0026162B3E|nr:RloB family protein [Giesbergeria sp.]MDD2609873.1 RloB family protein [Giesbergeria sp.]